MSQDALIIDIADQEPQLMPLNVTNTPLLLRDVVEHAFLFTTLGYIYADYSTEIIIFGLLFVLVWLFTDEPRNLLQFVLVQLVLASTVAFSVLIGSRLRLLFYSL